MDDCTLACEHCLYVQDDRLAAVIDSGFWPGNLTRKYQYLVSKKLFAFFDCLHKFLPGTSISGFLHTLEELSARNGRVCVIKYSPYNNHTIYNFYLRPQLSIRKPSLKVLKNTDIA